MKRSELFEKVIDYFKENMPVAETELHYKTPYELLVAVILSAQCTDKRVNIITPAFFNAFPEVERLANAEISEIFDLIKSCSYPNNKAKSLHGMALVVSEKFKGVIPDNYEELIQIPGVGRKTAHVILSVAFQQNKMAVDTHVHRVSGRIGLTLNSKNPLETERQLMKYIPEELAGKAHHWLILHGRYVCKARNPQCPECGLTVYCKYYKMKKNINNE